jgi:hypothetical protein
MATQLDKLLTDHVVLESEKRFAELIEMARGYSPNVRTSIRANNLGGEVQVSLGILHDPAGDELAVEISLAVREEDIWCDLTLFVGQATRVSIAVSCWQSRQPTVDEVTAVIGDAFSFVKSRAERVFQELVHR